MRGGHAEGRHVGRGGRGRGRGRGSGRGGGRGSSGRTRVADDDTDTQRAAAAAAPSSAPASTMRRIRTFVAIVLPVDVQAALDCYTQTLRAATPAGVVRWEPAANLHLTLSFLGDVDAAALPAVKAALRRVAAAHPPHTLRVGGVGSFPGGAAAPRVVWAGVEGCAELAALQADVAECLVPLGFPKEQRPFSPHLTLGRVAGGRPSRKRKQRRGAGGGGADGAGDEGSSGNDGLRTLAQALGDSDSFGGIPPTGVSGFSLMRTDAGVYSSQADFELLGTSAL